MAEQDTHTPTDLLTYAEAAAALGLSHSYVTQLASQHILHAIKLPGKREKYFQKEEITWYHQRRQGNRTSNPLEINIQVPFTYETTQGVQDLLLGGQGIVLLLSILVDYMANTQPSTAHLRYFKNEHRFAPLRRAILKLSGELVA